MTDNSTPPEQKRQHIEALSEMLYAGFIKLSGPNDPDAKLFAQAIEMAATRYFADIMGEAETIEALLLRADLIERLLIHAQKRGYFNGKDSPKTL